MEVVSTFLTWLTAPLYGEPNRSIPLETYLRGAQTGDIMLFSSHTAGQLLQRFFTFSRYSHVGIVIRATDGNVYVWHSTVHVKTNDLLTSTQKNGPQLSSAGELVRGYFGNGGYLVAIRRLMGDEPVPNATLLESRLVHHCMRKLVGTDYDNNLLRLFSGYFTQLHHTPFGDLIQPPNNEFYCSELAAASLIVMGIIDEKRQFDEYAPVDFGETWPNLPLKQPYYYGPEYKIEV